MKVIRNFDSLACDRCGKGTFIFFSPAINPLRCSCSNCKKEFYLKDSVRRSIALLVLGFIITAVLFLSLLLVYSKYSNISLNQDFVYFALPILIIVFCLDRLSSFVEKGKKLIPLEQRQLKHNRLLRLLNKSHKDEK